MDSSKMAVFFPSFLYSQLLVHLPYPNTSFSHQTVIVTGSNTGLGLEAARHLTRLGAAKVILAVRSISKGEAAANDILETCHVPEETLEVWKLDMGDIESIKSFAKRADKLERLDAAILNAGILTQKYDANNNSLKMENTIAVNAVGTMLLSTLLLPTLRRSAKITGHRGRLAIVGSDLMYVTNPAEVDTQPGQKVLLHLSNPETASMTTRYPLSKLLVFYSLREFARRSPLSASATNPIITDLTPGACKSSIFRDDMSWLQKLPMAVGNALLARTTEVGGRTLVFCASPELPESAHGRFVCDNKVMMAKWDSVDNPANLQRAEKWNEELFPLLEELAPGCTRF